MNKFIFKSSKGLLKNSSNTLDTRLDLILNEQRRQRQDLQDVKLMINRLLVNKHLQMQVDEYFEDNPENDIQEEADQKEDRD